MSVLGLTLQSTGSNNGTWGIVLNADFSIIGNRIASHVSVDCSGSSDITVSAAQAQNKVHLLTGTLTGNIDYIMPDADGEYIIYNGTSGAFTLTVTDAHAGTGVTIPQGLASVVYVNSNTDVVNSTISYLPALQADAFQTAAFVSTGTTSFAAGSIDASAIGSLPSNPIPPGAIFDYAVASAPAGFLLCYGQAVSRTTYSALFSAIGTVFGAGDASTTFNLPDYRGRVGFGADNMGGVAANRLTNSATGGIDGSAIANSGGEQAHVLITGELATHSHTASGLSTSTAGSHSHTVSGTTTAGGGVTAVLAEVNTAINLTATSSTVAVAGDHSHTITGSIDTTGSSSSHNTVPPGLVVYKIIKT